MKKKLLIIPTLVISLFLIRAVIISRSNSNQLQTQTQSTASQLLNLTDVDTAQLTFKDIMLNLQVARSSQKQQTGLMGITRLEDNSGMLFIFDQFQPQTFWMKDTLIPLDIIFLDQNLKVVTLYKSTQANQTSILYPSNLSVQYALELNGGWSEKNGLNIGDSFKI